MNACRLNSFWLCLMLLVSPSLYAEQFKDFTGHEVHYSAFNSSFLSPDVAKAYNIRRSGSRGMLNIAVLAKNGMQRTPVGATVKGSVKNLIGQMQPLTFTEIREGEAVYYIANFRFTNDEILQFSIDVQAESGGAPMPFSFKQHFYVD